MADGSNTTHYSDSEQKNDEHNSDELTSNKAEGCSNSIEKGPYKFCGIADHLKFADGFTFFTEFQVHQAFFAKELLAATPEMGLRSFAVEFVPIRVGTVISFDNKRFNFQKESAFVTFGFLHHSEEECKVVIADVLDLSFYAMPIPAIRIELDPRDCQAFVVEHFQQFEVWVNNLYENKLSLSEIELPGIKVLQHSSLGKKAVPLRESFRRRSALDARKRILQCSPSSPKKMKIQESTGGSTLKQLEKQKSSITALTKTVESQGKRIHTLEASLSTVKSEMSKILAKLKTLEKIFAPNKKGTVKLLKPKIEVSNIEEEKPVTPAHPQLQQPPTTFMGMQPIFQPQNFNSVSSQLPPFAMPFPQNAVAGQALPPFASLMPGFSQPMTATNPTRKQWVMVPPTMEWKLVDI